jgi:2-amino-4-hydroxy-6-hydroxymethyldihydropteridine diphosphokinase
MMRHALEPPKSGGMVCPVEDRVKRGSASETAPIEGPGWVVLGLGSNLGDRARNLRFARESLGGAVGGFPVASSVWETRPEGGPAAQGLYLNQVIAAPRELILLPAAGLLEAARTIERLAGRQRSERWGPRPLDIDLLLVGNELIRTAELSVPHPRMTARRFVLGPLAEILPDLIHPISGLTALELWHVLEPGRDPCPGPAPPRTMPATRP